MRKHRARSAATFTCADAGRAVRQEPRARCVAMTDDPERSAEHATPFRAPTATVSSLKSEDSTERLICASPRRAPNSEKAKSVTSKSAEAGSDGAPARRRSVVVLGLAQVVLGALLVGAGAVAALRGAALARAGAGLWAGCVAVVAGVVGVLAGIDDCYGLHRAQDG